MSVNTAISDWIREAQRLLAELRQFDFGYPLGENVIHLAAQPCNLESLTAGFPAGARQQLTEFYEHCNGLSWPDVRNGLFIESVGRLFTTNERGEPMELFDRKSGGRVNVLAFGTDGGGGRFCIERPTGKIIHVIGGTLSANRLEVDSDQVSSVADDFNSFLVRLQSDLGAFIADDRDHQYLA